MADMRGFGIMNTADRGGTHRYEYPDGGLVKASAGETPSQTVGPFFAYGMTPGAYGYSYPEIHKSDLAGPNVEGDRIVIEGQVFDGNGAAVHDAVVEIFQADARGSYPIAARNDGFTGFGRCGTGADGPEGARRYLFRTIKPGQASEASAPAVNVIVAMRGLLNHFVTRMYFPEDNHESDPVMIQVPKNRRSTLIAELIAPNHYRFDIRMQGDGETVFFDL